MAVANTAGHSSSESVARRSAADSSETQPVCPPLPVPPPASVLHVVALVAGRLCRRLLLPPAATKLSVYLSAVAVVSLAVQLAPRAVPLSYFADKHNALNVYLVKLGWLWTLVVSGALVTLTARVAAAGQWRRVRAHWLRLAAATAVWYLATALFLRVRRSVGVCRRGAAGGAADPHATFDTCDGRWHGLDISGHTFLLVLAGLVLAEEAASLDGWTRLADWLLCEQHVRSGGATQQGGPLPGGAPVTPLRPLTDAQLAYVAESYYGSRGACVVVFGALATLAVVWDVMLLATALYFHTVLEKVAGAVVAGTGWWLVYRWAPRRGLLVAPGANGLFNYRVQAAPSMPSRRQRSRGSR